jgi:hypothetical protein
MNNDSFFSPYNGAVSLSFDDGTPDQLERAVPMLDRYHLKATFYLMPNGASWQDKLHPWIKASHNGHEMGNHSISHICSNNITGQAGGLEDKSLDEIEQDILLAQQRLSTLFPWQKQWTFAYPCYCTFVGTGQNRQSYVPLIATHFLAGRGGGEYGFANHPLFTDLSCLYSIPVEEMTGFEMIGLVEELTAQHRWVILTFHKIDGERLSVSSWHFDMLLAYLRRNDHRILTAPVAEIAEKIVHARSSS